MTITAKEHLTVNLELLNLLYRTAGVSDEVEKRIQYWQKVYPAKKVIAPTPEETLFKLEMQWLLFHKINCNNK